MKYFKHILSLAIVSFLLNNPSKAQTDYSTDFNKVLKMMETAFNTAKSTKGAESSTNYGVMILTKKTWASNYKFPESKSAEITEILRQAPDPKLAGHNVYITFNFANNVSKEMAEAAFNSIKDKIKTCTPANWKIKENNGPTYAKYAIMDGPYYDEAPHKVTLQFNKLAGSEKYTADIIFDTVVK
jgi:hypothetical protein